MNSEKLNTYLTVGANLAVLIGLVFVGIELRNSNASIAAQTNYSITEGFNSINMALAGDPELMRINVVGDQEPEKLTDQEAAAYWSVLQSYLNQYLQVYRLRQSGAMTEQEWSLYAREAYRWLKEPGPQAYIEDNEVGQLLFEAIQDYAPDKPNQ